MSRDELWDALKAHSKKRKSDARQRRLEQAKAEDDGGWTKHTPYHWSRYIGEERLDYWPSTGKLQFMGEVVVYPIQKFLNDRRK